MSFRGDASLAPTASYTSPPRARHADVDLEPSRPPLSPGADSAHVTVKTTGPQNGVGNGWHLSSNGGSGSRGGAASSQLNPELVVAPVSKVRRPRSVSVIPDGSTPRDFAVKVSLVVAFYYVTSAYAGILNKEAVHEAHVTPFMLTLIHLIMSIGFDVLWLAGAAPVVYGAQRASVFPPNWLTTVAVFAPISFFIIFGKLATYFSYEYVSMALTHTAKASEPVFNVLLAAVLFREYHSAGVYLSLLPIAAGVGLASITEMSYNHIGFVCAVFSALMKVLQNIFTKRIMLRDQFSFFQLHLYCGVASLLVLMPLMVAMGEAELSGAGMGKATMWPLLWCGLMQYVSSVSSYWVLTLLAHLSFTITNTMKRLFIIASATWYFGRGFTLTNAAGVALAIGGILAYNASKYRENVRAAEARAAARKDLGATGV